MKLNSKQDIEAPIAEVWQALSDFPAWERAAMRRGAEVSRTDGLTRTAPGMAWAARFRLRGQDRSVTLRLAEIEPDTRLLFEGRSKLFVGTLAVDLVAMSARRTRIHVITDLTPVSLAARLLLQSARLARSRITQRYDSRIAQLAAEIEARQTRS
jgi:carbon monoxide dehydrogenase subunit G